MIQQKNDDGCRKMPKLFCPVCGKRAMDSKNKELRAFVQLVERTSPLADYFIICPQCKSTIGVHDKEHHAKCVKDA